MRRGPETLGYYLCRLFHGIFKAGLPFWEHTNDGTVLVIDCWELILPCTLARTFFWLAAGS